MNKGLIKEKYVFFAKYAITLAQNDFKHDTPIIFQISKKINMNKGLIKEKYVFFAKYAITLIFHVYKTYIKYMIILLQLAEKYINNELK